MKRSGCAPEGGAAAFIAAADNTYGGKTVQLRGSAEQRQVPDARVALQHKLGLGGACVVTLYRSA
jgi:sterol carrier protein 2